MKKYLLILILSFYSLKAHSLIEVDITRGNLDPLPIAISPLHVDIKSDQIKDKEVKELGNEIAKIIENNLEPPTLIKLLFSSEIYGFILLS